MAGPINPNEIGKAKAQYIPEVVFEVVNELIALRFTGNSARIYQKDIVNVLLKRDPTLTAEIIFHEGYLNFEEAYREAGWHVDYDKPAYNEFYEACFTFKKK